jgi:hypothetical protein
VEYEERNGHTSLNGHDLERNGHAAGNGHAATNGHVTSNGHASTNDDADSLATNGQATNGAVAKAESSRRRADAAPALHQVGEARRRQGLSVRCIAQRLSLTVGEVRAKEEPQADMLLSELYRWQSVLEVPLEELLADPQESLSSRVLTRARMLRVMKTARALRAQARTESEHRLAKLLISQLIEIMPELKEVAAWPTVGHRRTADEMGRIAERTIPDDFMHEAS